jgi:hypothetical protein
MSSVTTLCFYKDFKGKKGPSWPWSWFTNSYQSVPITWLVGFMMFNTTFNNISIISWRSVLLVEKTGESGENHWPVTSHWQTLSHNVVHLALIETRDRAVKQFEFNWGEKNIPSTAKSLLDLMAEIDDWTKQSGKGISYCFNCLEDIHLPILFYTL